MSTRITAELRDAAEAASRAATATARREMQSPALTPLERRAFVAYAAAKRSREVWEPLWRSWMA